MRSEIAKLISPQKGTNGARRPRSGWSGVINTARNRSRGLPFDVWEAQIDDEENDRSSWIPTRIEAKQQSGSLVKATLSDEERGMQQFISGLKSRWNLSDDDIAAMLGLGSAIDARLFMEGSFALKGRDAEDRVANLFCIYEALFGLFRDAENERRWLRHESTRFEGKTHLDAMREGRLEDLIDVRRWVEYLAGR